MGYKTPPLRLWDSYTEDEEDFDDEEYDDDDEEYDDDGEYP